MDATGNRQEKVTIGEDGYAGFPVNGGSVSVWVQETDEN
ncbi:alpha-amylase domain-containing protein [Weizmannia sp. CD-2023]|nr:alpha-amylase domain-containing protein [Weizmannia sp. CD-2023]